MAKKWIVALVSLFIISLIGGVIEVSAAQTSSKDVLTELQTEAKQLGITTDDKDIRELKKEIHEKKVIAAVKIGSFPGQGEITISLQPSSNEQIIITIADNGPGIPIDE
jgi:nitrogen fixation/metabolism regulation signal transduction histidine kinase